MVRLELKILQDKKAEAQLFQFLNGAIGVKTEGLLSDCKYLISIP